MEGSTDPKVGAFVLALPMSYGVPAALVTVDGDDIVFPYGDNTTTPGYDVKDGRLVEREAGDELRMPVAQLRSLRLERPIEVDPDGFVVSVDEVPGDSLMWGVLWLLLMGLMLVNVVSLVVWWRNRSAAAAA